MSFLDDSSHLMHASAHLMLLLLSTEPCHLSVLGLSCRHWHPVPT